MDEAARQKLNMKFAKLTIILNAVFLFTAIAVLAIADVIPFYRIPIAVVFGLASIVLAVYFVGAYRRDKAWLASVPDDKPGEAAGKNGEKAAPEAPAQEDPASLPPESAAKTEE